MARVSGDLERFEEELVEAWGNLLHAPDRERGWLVSGQRSWWPPIVRDVIMDYADADAQPRRQLSRREANAVARMFTSENCLCLIVPAGDRRALLGVVLTLRALRGAPGAQWQWSDVWQRMGGRACGVSSDALRVRYVTQLERLAWAWEMWKVGTSGRL